MGPNVFIYGYGYRIIYENDITKRCTKKTTQDMARRCFDAFAYFIYVLNVLTHLHFFIYNNIRSYYYVLCVCIPYKICTQIKKELKMYDIYILRKKKKKKKKKKKNFEKKKKKKKKK